MNSRPASDVTITLEPVADLAALEARWRVFEAEADISFFQSATWTFCRAAERFPQPYVLEARSREGTRALALFNAQRDHLFLGESGDPERDTPFIEHNGILLARDARPTLLADCLAALRGRPLTFSGVSPATAEAARAAGLAIRLRAERTAPAIDFTHLPGAWIDTLSANTRQQLRRSHRAYARAGTLALHRARDAAEAADFLDALATLHQVRWTARGAPGAFASPAFRRFHAELLARALPRGEAQLLRLDAGGRPIGYLYNFRHRGRHLAYQGGFDYATVPGKSCKPGLTCHHVAIEAAHAEGAVGYDFLAGADRYKQSLANSAHPMVWLDSPRRFSAAWALARLGV